MDALDAAAAEEDVNEVEDASVAVKVEPTATPNAALAAEVKADPGQIAEETGEPPAKRPRLEEQEPIVSAPVKTEELAPSVPQTQQ